MEQMSHISTQHIRGAAEVVGAGEIERAPAEMDAKGIDRQLREGFDFDPDMPKLMRDSDDDSNGEPGGAVVDDTSDEEAELPGTHRPKRGAGWWGRVRL